MSLNSRLDRIVPTLSGRQRAVLVLRAITAGEEPDPGLRKLGDRAEGRQFDRYMAFIYVANVELEGICHSIQFEAQRLEEDRLLKLLRWAAELAQEQTGETVNPKVVKTWRKQQTITTPELLLGIADEVRQVLLRDVLSRCSEMKALEEAWNELALEFDGEDEPSLRQKAEDTWATLQRLLGSLGGPKRLPAASPLAVEVIRQRVEHAFEFLGMAGPKR
jgi:hypothetical protein